MFSGGSFQFFLRLGFDIIDEDLLYLLQDIDESCACKVKVPILTIT